MENLIIFGRVLKFKNFMYLNPNQNFKDLFLKLVAFDDKIRPNSIKDIFNVPWLNELKILKMRIILNTKK